MSELLRIELATLQDIGAALKDVKNTDDSVRVDAIGNNIRELKGTATSDKVFAGETYLGANGVSQGTFTLEEELTEQETALSEIEEMLEAKLGGYPIEKVNPLIPIVERTATEITAEDLEGITKIGSYVFQAYGNLVKITFPKTLKEIGAYAFKDCTSLEEIVIPTNITKIEAYAFMGCKKIHPITYSLEHWCSMHFISQESSPAYYRGDLYLGDTLLTNLVIPESITVLKQCIFAYLKCLKSVEMHENITAIEGYTFYRCLNLETVTVRAITPPSLASTTTFMYVPDTCNFYVPAESVEAYKSATNWSQYADRIFPIEEV